MCNTANPGVSSGFLPPDGKCELYFPTSGAAASVSILGVQGSCLVIQASTEQSCLTLDACAGPAAPAWLRYMRGNSARRMPCRVIGASGSGLQLEVAGPVQSATVRDRQRFPCRLPILYRAVRLNGIAGCWLEGEVVDISLGGARLRVSERRQFPDQVLFQITLPYREESGALESSRPHDAKGRRGEAEMDLTPVIRGSARTRHGVFTFHDETIVGIQFDSLAPACRLELSWYLAGLVADLMKDRQQAA